MRYLWINSLFIVLASVLVGCNSTEKVDKDTNLQAESSWAYPLVKWENETYVVTQEEVSEQKIGIEIGEVTVYSTMEGSYGGNFSNMYKEGTKYYEINDKDINEVIAIRNKKGQFIKAVISDKWEDEKNL